jgi:putative lipoic acid-binding regulatory protein
MTGPDDDGGGNGRARGGPSTLPEVPPERSLIDYPSDFPIKVMGAQVDGFVAAVVEIALRHDPGFDPATIEHRPSRAGNYLGLTLTVRATSRQQLDDLYRALTAHPLVKVVL